MAIVMDAKGLAREIALGRLAKLKKKEQSEKRHVWMGQGLIISHGTLEGLREMVEGAGFKWKDGKLEK